MKIKNITSGDLVVFNARRQKYPLEMLTLFYGTNESGKTTIFDGIVDAIFKLRRDSRFDIYGYQKVYPRQFEIEVEIEIDGKTVIFTPQDKESLQEKQKFSHYYIQYLFCVRDTDIRWWGSRRSDFGRQLLRDISSQIDLIKVEKITYENLQLTPKGALTDREENQQKNLKDNISNLTREIEAAKNYILQFQKLQKEQQKLISQISESEKQKSKLKEELEKMISLKKRDDLLKAEKVKKELLLNEKKLINFARYKEDDLENWKEMERKKLENQTKRGEMLRQKEETQSKLRDSEIETAEMEKRINESKSLGPSTEYLKEKINKYSAELDKIFQKETIMRYCPVVSIILLLVSLFCFILSVSKLLFLAPASLLLLLSVVFFISWHYFDKKKNEIQKLKEAIVNSKDKELMEKWLGAKSSSFEEVKKMISQFDKEVDRNEVLITEQKAHRDKLKNEISVIEKKIEEINITISKQQEKIKDYCDRTGLTSVQDLEKKLKEKKEIEYEMKGKRAIIEQILGTANESEWETKLTQLEALRDKQGKWDEERMKSLEKQINQLQKNIEEQNKEKEKLHRSIVDLANRSATRPLEKILEELKDKKAELTDIQNRHEAGQLCDEIFYQLRREAGDPLGEICREGGKNSISNYFAMITNQRYKEVKIKQRDISPRETLEEEKIPWEIVAVLANGKELFLSQLSWGTRVPLYFLFRIKFLEKVLKGKKGFLLLDDPFLPCHSGRLKNMVDLMWQLTREGWQIVYFTIDERIRNLLQKQKAKIYELPEIPVQ